MLPSRCSYYTYITLLIISVSACSSIKSKSNKNETLVKAAQKELPSTLKKIPEGKELAYGFKSRDEFKSAKIGEPFKFNTYRNSQFTEESTFSAPVVVDSEYRALATLASINDTTRIVDFGASVLAQEIQQIQQQNPSYQFKGILRVYKFTSDFAILTKDQNSYYFPLTSAKIYLSGKGGIKIENYYTESQLLTLLNS